MSTPSKHTVQQKTIEQTTGATPKIIKQKAIKQKVVQQKTTVQNEQCVARTNERDLKHTAVTKKHTATTKQHTAATKKHAATTSAQRARNLKPLAAALALSMGLPLAAQAATITVNTTTIAAAGACGLSDAISAANNNAAINGCSAGSGDDSIVFASALTNQTITVTSDLPVITSSVSITGPTGFSQGTGLHISGDNALRIFHINGAVNVTVENLTLKNGSSSNNGSAIYAMSGALLTVSNSTFSGNRGGRGGAIYAKSASPTVNNSTFSSNSASGNGGGAIYTRGGVPLTVSGSTFSNNSGLRGGAIHVYRDALSLTVTNSTFSSNSAGSNGGAIHAMSGIALTNSTFSNNVSASRAGALNVYNKPSTISNCTFSGNRSTSRGGAIHSYSASLTVSNSTLSGNTGGLGGAILFGGTISPSLVIVDTTIFGNRSNISGSAIHAEYNNNVSFTLRNSVISGSSGGSGNDCPTIASTASLTSFTKVWLQNNSSCTGTGIAGFDASLSGNPLLGPLANNGGPTPTHLPASNSPLIGKGQTNATHDQRGVARDPAKQVIGAVTVTPPVVSSNTAAGSYKSKCGGSGALGFNPAWWSLVLSLGAVRKYLARRRRLAKVALAKAARITRTTKRFKQTGVTGMQPSHQLLQ